MDDKPADLKENYFDCFKETELDYRSSDFWVFVL